MKKFMAKRTMPQCMIRLYAEVRSGFLNVKTVLLCI